jgi:PRD1 phage membrane DNA delivery
MNFNSEMWTALTTIFVAIIGVASLAVFFGKNSTTPQVIQNSFSGLSNALNSAEAPVLNSNQTGQATYAYVQSANGSLTDPFSA